MRELPLYKIVVLGGPDVGKTALCKSWCLKLFSSDKKTRGDDFFTTEVKFRNGDSALELWDIADGNVPQLLPSYFNQAAAAILVWDVTNIDTINALEKWLQNLRHYFGHAIPPLVFACAKFDLCNEDNIPSDQAERLQRLIKQFEIEHYKIVQVSSKSFTAGETLQKVIINFLDKSEAPAPQAPTLPVSTSTLFSSEPSQKQMRLARFHELKRSLQNTGTGKLNSREYIWFLMNIISISKPESLMRQFCERQISIALNIYFPDREPYTTEHHAQFLTVLSDYDQEKLREFYGAKLQQFCRIRREFCQDFLLNRENEVRAISALLKLLDEKEVPSFAVQFCLFDIKAKRKQERAEMVLIYQLARRIYDFIYKNSIGNNQVQAQGHDNDNNSTRLIQMTREELLQDIEVDIPQKIRRIIDELFLPVAPHDRDSCMVL